VLTNGIYRKIRTMIKVSKSLPGEEVKACIMPTLNPRIAEGLSTGSGQFVTFYNDNSPSDEGYIASPIAHEYVDSVDPIASDVQNVLNVIIAEGKAFYFQKKQYPNTTWLEVYEDKEQNWRKVKQKLYATDLDSIYYVMGGANDLPTNFGYSEGYKIIESLLQEEPNLTIKEVIEMDAKTILNRSRYYSKKGK
jgi:uncharacterized protein YjaZ